MKKKVRDYANTIKKCVNYSNDSPTLIRTRKCVSRKIMKFLFIKIFTIFQNSGLIFLKSQRVKAASEAGNGAAKTCRYCCC